MFADSTSSDVLRDEIQELKRQLAELQRELAKHRSSTTDPIGKRAAEIGHDFSNLLTIILGYSNELKQSLPRHDPLQAHVEQIESAANRAAALTSQLLAISRKQTDSSASSEVATLA
jgi:two-component system, cell cycle sensor histidine kinase and response regulator CckA